MDRFRLLTGVSGSAVIAILANDDDDAMPLILVLEPVWRQPMSARNMTLSFRTALMAGSSAIDGMLEVSLVFASLQNKNRMQTVPGSIGIRVYSYC
jgi:hypothetical protein